MATDSRLRFGTEASEYTYGMISPEGKFTRVAWGEHVDFAYDWVEEEPDRFRRFIDSDYFSPLDFMVHGLGWVLLHNPNMGEPYTTTPDKGITKRQREFLYDYYTKAGRERDATALYEEGA